MRWQGLALVGACCGLGALFGACSRDGFHVGPDARVRRDAARVDAPRRDSGVLPAQDRGLRRDGAARDSGAPERDATGGDALQPQRDAALRDAAPPDSAPADQTPDAFAFTDLSDQPLGSIILSNAPAITGFSGTVLASVTGGGSPALRVEGGAWGPSALLRPGQALQLQLTSSPDVTTTRVAVVNVGTAQVTWSVRTKSGSTRIFTTAGPLTGNLGGLGNAHATCQFEASRLGYSGIFRALLSTRGIAAKDLLTITYPVVRASDGVVVDGVYLWDGALTNPVRPTPAGTNAWTWTGGLGNDPAGSDDSCGDWRSTNANGRVGLAQTTDAYWLHYTPYDHRAACTQGNYLYCVEQPRALGPVLTFTPRSTALVVGENGSPGYGKAVTLTVENVGDQTTVPLVISLSNSTNFELTTDSCAGKSLASGMTCTVVVRPRAWNAGTFAGTVGANAPGSAQADLSLVAGTLVFRTATTLGGNLGGLTGADGICATAAAGAGLPGVFKAVLSDATTHAVDRFSIRYPVITTNGKVIASANFWSQNPENGGAASIGPSSTDFVWTGTQPGGVRSTDTCRSWTSDAAGDLGRQGQASATDYYTCPRGSLGPSVFNCGSTSCTTGRALLCMSE